MFLLLEFRNDARTGTVAPDSEHTDRPNSIKKTFYNVLLYRERRQTTRLIQLSQYIP